MDKSPSNLPEPECACCTWWRLPLLFAALLALILLVRVSGNRESSRDAHETTGAESPAAATGEVVSLEIRFNRDRSKEYDEIPWHKGMTVSDVLTASQHLGGFRYEVLGNGPKALLISIDDASNEGGGGRNWTYSVNGKLADRSFAIYELKPDDRVLWTFEQEP